MKKGTILFAMGLIVLLTLLAVLPAGAAIERGDYYAGYDSEYREYGYIQDIMLHKYEYTVFDNETDAFDNALTYITNMLSGNNDNPANQKCRYIQKDLNSDAGTCAVTLGWTTTLDPSDAITGLRLWNSDDEDATPPGHLYDDGVNWYLVNSGVHDWAPRLNNSINDPTCFNSVDLNEGVGGDFIYLYVTKDPGYGPPLTRIDVQWFDDDSTAPTEKDGEELVRTFTSFGTTKNTVLDLNENAGGQYIYLKAVTTLDVVDIDYLKTLAQVGERIQSNPSLYRISDEDEGRLYVYVEESKRIIPYYEKNGPYVTNVDYGANITLPTIKYFKELITSVQGKIILDAETNGGTGNTEVWYTLNSQGNISFLANDLEKPTREGYTFTNWTYESGITVPGVIPIVLTPGSTLYANYEKEIQAEFYYLDASGNKVSKTVTGTMKNLEKTATYDPVSTSDIPKTVVLDGGSYTLAGWNTSTSVGPPLSALQGIGAITTAPADVFYALYKSPTITLSFDTNGGSSIEPMTGNCYISVNKNSNWLSFILPAAERGCHVFQGWSLDGETVQYAAGDRKGIKQDTTLYAIYEPAHSYDGNGVCTVCTTLQTPACIDGVYQIGNAGELYQFSRLVRDDPFINAVLTADIDYSISAIWSGIGYSHIFDPNTATLSELGYRGTFDGQGHVIRNIPMSDGGLPLRKTVGIFGTVSGTIKNVGVENFTYVKTNTTDGRFGALVGLLAPGGVIENCYVINSTVDAADKVAGIIAGANYGGIIRNCYSYGCTVSGYTNDSNGQARFGWIVGDNNNDGTGENLLTGQVINCVTDGLRVAGTQSGTVTSCWANVTAARFASGEMAYFLRAGNTTSVWGQTLGTDDLPVLGGAQVVRVTVQNCKLEFVKYEYANGTADYTRVSDHTFSGNALTCINCKEYCGHFEKIYISLGEDITVYYQLKMVYPNSTMRFTVGDYTKTVEGVENSNTYAFAGVAPQWIGDVISAELIVDGKVVELKEYSVLRYLNELKAQTATDLGYSAEKYDAMITLIDDLLVYGAAAQTFTGHNTDAPVSAGVTGSKFEAVTSTDTAGDPNGEAVTFNGMNVYFTYTNRLLFRFAAENTDGLSFTVRINGGEETPITFAASGEYYIIMTDAIGATGFDDVYTVTAYKNGVADAYLTYSVRSYVYAKQNGTGDAAELAKALYNYGVSAKAYLNAA